MSAGGMYEDADDGAVENVVNDQQQQGFRIYNEVMAETAIESILTYRRRIEIRKAALANLEREAEYVEAWLTSCLEDWYRQHPPHKGKTLKFATGSVSARTNVGGIRVEDEAACTEWCEAFLPEAIRRHVERKIDVERVKRESQRIYSQRLAEVFQSCDAVDGEQAAAIAIVEAKRALPPGVVVVDDVEVFTVKPPKGA